MEVASPEKSGGWRVSYADALSAIKKPLVPKGFLFFRAMESLTRFASRQLRLSRLSELHENPNDLSQYSFRGPSQNGT